MLDAEKKGSWTRLAPMYLTVGILCMLAPGVDYVVEEINLYAVFPWPFLLFAVAGFWAGKLSSVPHAVLAGALMGVIMTATRGFVMPLFGMPVPPEETVKVGFYILVATMSGAILGFLGGLSGLAFTKFATRKST